MKGHDLDWIGYPLIVLQPEHLPVHIHKLVIFGSDLILHLCQADLHAGVFFFH